MTHKHDERTNTHSRCIPQNVALAFTLAGDGCVPVRHICCSDGLVACIFHMISHALLKLLVLILSLILEKTDSSVGLVLECLDLLCLW